MLNDPAEPILPGPGPGPATGATGGTTEVGGAGTYPGTYPDTGATSGPSGPTEAAGQVASTAAERGGEVAGHAAERGSEVAGHAAQRGGEVVGTAAEQAREVVGTAAEQARTLAGQAKDQARTVIQDAAQQARDQSEQQARRAAGSLRQTGDQLRALAEGRPDEAGQAGEWARQLAEQLSTVAQRVEDGGVEGVLRDVSRFARRRPGVFLLGAAAAGFAVGRMIKNAGSDDDGSQRLGQGDGQDYGQTYGYAGAYGSPSAAYDYGLTGPAGSVAASPAVGAAYDTPAPDTVGTGGWSEPAYGTEPSYGSASAPGADAPSAGPGVITGGGAAGSTVGGPDDPLYDTEGRH